MRLVDAAPAKECRSADSLPADVPLDLRQVVTRLPASLVISDVDGRITFANNFAEQLYGYKCSELLGQPLTIFQAQPDAAMLDAVRQTGSLRSTSSHRTCSGAVFDAFVCLTLLPGEQKRPPSILQLSIDLTRQLETQLTSETAQPETESKPRSSASRPVVVQRDIGGVPFIIASRIMHKFMGLVDRVASHHEMVLITGETGTGKDLVARTIHQSSFRAEKQFVEINCAALPEHLVESELFGYEKGAFSGADSAKPGLFEIADKGTLFLDEIGELPLHIQVKLLRVLDGSSYFRLGGHKQVSVDVRVVAATNQDLETAVKEGRFRRDLFHRLGQFHLSVPPLRDRPEDIAVLARHFLAAKANQKRLADEVIRVLQSHSWPGNIRELRNVITKLAVDSPTDEITAEEVWGEISHEYATRGESSGSTIAIPGDLDAMEEQAIMKALERTHGHRALAAEQLGISRRTLSRKLREYQINPPGRAGNFSLGAISWEQQKSYRGKVQFPVRLKTAQGEELTVTAVNLSSRGMGVEGLTRPAQCDGVVETSFEVPGEDLHITAKARIMWSESQGRAGIRFVSMAGEELSKLQNWANRKMQEEGWELAQ